MSNWTQILDSDLEPDIVAAAEEKTAGSTANAIAEAVAAVRGAIVTGNSLDMAPTKVPNSLKGITARRAQFILKVQVLQMALGESENGVRKSDDDWLKRYQDKKTRFKLPDNSSTTAAAEFQTSETVQQIGHVPRQTGRERSSGL